MNIARRGPLFLASAVAALAIAHSTPAGAAPPLEAYGSLPQVEFLQVSPSGERIAMIGVAGEQRQLVLAEVAGNRLLKAAAIGDTKVRDVQWAGNDHVLVDVSVTSGPLYDYGLERWELYGVIHVGLDDGKPWSVFGHSDDIEHVVFGYSGAYPQDGHWSGYFTGRTLQHQRGFGAAGYTRQQVAPDLYRVDLDTSKPTLIAGGAGRDHTWVVNSDGTIAAHTEFNAETGDWVLYAGRDRDRTLVHEVSQRGEIRLKCLGRRPGTVIIVDRSGPGDIISEIDVTTGKAEPLLDDVSVREYLQDPLTGLLIGAATNDEPFARFFDAAIQKHYNSTRKAFANQRMTLASFSPNLKDMVVFTDGTADPGTYWFVNGTTHRADPIAYPYPQIKSADVGPVRRIEYKATDGLALDGILTLPPRTGSGRLPLVVMPHGGPIGEHDDPGFDWWAQAFASRGYAVFQPNYRGSGGHGVAFRKAGYGEWGRRMLGDIADGVAELGRQGIADPARACIVGASYGGYAALAGVTVQQGLYRCAVSVAGPANLSTFLAEETNRYGINNPHGRFMQEVIGATGSSDPVLRTISPASLARRADAPVLLIHGRDDTRVPIEQSREMAAALKGAGKTYEFVELPKEDHFLSRDATRIAMLKAAVGFVGKYNPAQ